MDDTRWCMGCKEFMPQSSFWRRKEFTGRWESGLANYCRNCCAELATRNNWPDKRHYLRGGKYPEEDYLEKKKTKKIKTRT